MWDVVMWKENKVKGQNQRAWVFLEEEKHSEC